MLGRLAWFGSGWAAHTSADMGKVEKGINIPNFPGFEEKGKSQHSNFPRGRKGREEGRGKPKSKKVFQSTIRR